MRYIYIGIIMVLLSACALKVPPIASYDLAPKLTKAQVQICKKKTLKVLRTYGADILASRRMYYTQADAQVYAYNQSQWVIPPLKALSLQLQKALEEAGLFASVVSYESRVQSDYILESQVEEFMQYYSDAASSYVVVTFNLHFIEKSTHKLKASKKFSLKVPTPQGDAQGGVEAYNKALTQLLAQSVEWIKKVCHDK